MRIILASKSPDRKNLFKTICKNFEVIDSNFDESTIKFSSPTKLVKALAEGKCKSVFNSLQGERCVVGADTVVCIDNQIFGKPKDDEDAKRMLRLYSGRTNKVVTGVCVMYALEDGTEAKIIFANSSTIKFREISEDEITEFVNNKEYVGIAGACNIEGSAGRFMDKVIGSYHGIVGLPTSQLYQILKQENIL